MGQYLGGVTIDPLTGHVQVWPQIEVVETCADPRATEEPPLFAFPGKVFV